MKINKLLESKRLNEDVMSNISVNGKKLIQYLEQNKFTKSGDGKKSLAYTKTVDENSMVVSFTEIDIRVKLTADGKSQEVPFKHKEAAKAYKVIKKNIDKLESGKFKTRARGDNIVAKAPKTAKEIESAPLRQAYKSKAGTFKKVNTSTWEFTPANGGDSKQVRTDAVVNHFFPTGSSEKKDKEGKVQKDELGNTKYKKGSGIIGQRFKNVNSHLVKLLKDKYDVKSVSLKDKNTFLAYTSRGKQIKVGVEATKENKKGEVIEYQIKSIKESLQTDRRTPMKINKLLEAKNTGWSHFEFTSGANPYIAKTKEEAERVKRGHECSVHP